MKIALYIEDGLEQIVLTPESDTERAILGKLHDGSREFGIKRGSFYFTRGGWQRYGYIWPGSQDETDESTMIVLTPKPEQENPEDERPRTAEHPPAEPDRLSEAGDQSEPESD